MRPHLALLLAPLFGVAFFGCSSSTSSSSSTNAPPVVDSVDVPDTATATNGLYVVDVTVTAHDDDDTLAREHLHVEVANAQDPQDAPFGSNQKQGSVKFKLAFGGAPPGTYKYQVTVFDSQGAESAPVEKSITLK
jgi:hypothetical protein